MIAILTICMCIVVGVHGEDIDTPVTTTAAPTSGPSGAWSAEDFCSLPLQTGDCDSNWPRYFFNTSERQCQEFTYTGCNGNLNNFQTLDECIVFCRPSPKNSQDPADICAQPRVIGPCRAAIQRYYFNSTLNQCERFSYGGCDGNQNNFESQEECAKTCPPPPPPPTRGLKTRVLINNKSERKLETYPPMSPASVPINHQPVSIPVNNYPPPPVLAIPDMFGDPIEQINEFNRQIIQTAVPIAFPFPILRLRPQTSFLETSQYSYADALSKHPAAVRPATAHFVKTTTMITRNNPPLKRTSLSAHGQKALPAPRPEEDNPGFLERRNSVVRRPAHSYSMFQMGKQVDAKNCQDTKQVGTACDQSIKRIQIRFWYNPDTQLCEQFTYQGCGGNGNSFLFARDCIFTCNAKGLDFMNEK